MAPSTQGCCHPYMLSVGRRHGSLDRRCKLTESLTGCRIQWHVKIRCTRHSKTTLHYGCCSKTTRLKNEPISHSSLSTNRTLPACISNTAYRPAQYNRQVLQTCPLSLWAATATAAAGTQQHASSADLSLELVGGHSNSSSRDTATCKFCRPVS